MEFFEMTQPLNILLIKKMVGEERKAKSIFASIGFNEGNG